LVQTQRSSRDLLIGSHGRDRDLRRRQAYFSTASLHGQRPLMNHGFISAAISGLE
jgi:hypothetical protein